ncbi:MAG TPA: type I restriction enzyme HsdR N-terminal domain-containing protein [Chitinophagaceae bacterium]|nr:type I restriction enzyme HsdR N-terminal domain-containing protein [Chitinophagaceae bacterium]
MLSITFPPPQFKTEQRGEHPFIFDAIRKKWLRLTDEEWVRQNFVAYLLTQMHYPAALVALEKSLELNHLKKRFDILVYNRQHQPWMLVECKAASVPLTEATLAQVLRYNISIPVPYIVITNGSATFGWQKEAGDLKKLHALPQLD